MSESKRDWRADLKTFRERMGGLTEAKKAYFKADRDTRKALTEALKSGPKTIPELTRHLKLPGPEVVWYVMALKRYGDVVEAGQAGDYLTYALKESAS